MSQYIAAHANPFNQTKASGSRYSSRTVGREVVGAPVRCLHGTSVKGGVARCNDVSTGTVVHPTTGNYVTGYAMQVGNPIGTETKRLSAISAGYDLTWSIESTTFPDSYDTKLVDGTTNKPWRNIASGINVRSFAPNASTSNAILYAYVLLQDTMNSTSLNRADLEDKSIESWMVPISAGVTIRAPFVMSDLDFISQHRFEPTSPNVNLIVLIEWNTAVQSEILPFNVDFARFIEQVDYTDIGGATSDNMDESTFIDTMRFLDYNVGRDVLGIGTVPCIVEGFSFWSKTKNILSRVLKNIKQNPTLIGTLIGVTEAFLR
jgi:hypothetical protein